ncbi:hypothetical protein [Mycobacterium sp. GA-2829]|uniref:hypothetical protein n=1 Tax=Mycobacterium sp. GA-2829 TaxID=1772283 RepID=UPI000AE759FB|nr:hypothetical protein [Mycobacterium sp. GA-2829]
MSVSGVVFRFERVAVGVVSAAVGLALSACGTSAPPSAASGAGAQVGNEQSSEAGSELAYEDVGDCTVVVGPNPDYFDVAAPKAISFYDFLNGRTVTYEEYLEEQLALSDVDGYFATGYQEWVRPGGVEQMSTRIVPLRRWCAIGRPGCTRGP